MPTNPQDAAAKWARNLAASTQDITAGVNRVTTAPGQKAAAQVQVWLQQVQASANKWARNVGAVSLTEWQQAMINKGVPRIASGATAAQPKMQAFMTQFLPYVENVAQQVRAMPKGGLENGVARAVAQIRGNAGFQYNRSGATGF